VHDCADGYVYTAPVGSFAPNAFGLYDTIGNTFEWVADCWHDDYRGAPTDGSAWEGGDCSLHELRGGSWFTEPRSANGVSRNRFAADYRSNSFGFRVAREIAE
jgi:formylglycine-generating enzyme required for sulfatase activity